MKQVRVGDGDSNPLSTVREMTVPLTSVGLALSESAQRALPRLARHRKAPFISAASTRLTGLAGAAGGATNGAGCVANRLQLQCPQRQVLMLPDQSSRLFDDVLKLRLSLFS
uniref:Uncharacterized protein n=1 Tax=Cryptomonas curvata TaxID=233186 RepID=A0A7S0QQ80_9CRYP|mmetsp:Transcript_44637/g.93410  ORF Transcript_44637/g.93410 Transcript_44637/m.93410 type:complete len:112 (+) Transcript_44637:465-800(+)